VFAWWSLLGAALAAEPRDPYPFDVHVRDVPARRVERLAAGTWRIVPMEPDDLQGFLLVLAAEPRRDKLVRRLDLGPELRAMLDATDPASAGPATPEAEQLRAGGPTLRLARDGALQVALGPEAMSGAWRAVEERPNELVIEVTTANLTERATLQYLDRTHVLLLGDDPKQRYGLLRVGR
jgi:hypothetical protein